MNIPVILLTFANDQDAYLEKLKEENALINRALAPLEDRNCIRIYREESAGTTEVLNALNRFDGEIVVFHYSGHAGGKSLQMEKGDGFAEGLARLLARQRNLKFVFLNGCSTSPQVNRLLELGVGVVIATSGTVHDNKACFFAVEFYRKLATGSTLRQAFEFATDSLSFKFESVSEPVCLPFDRQRGLGSRSGETFQWGLYYQPESEELLDWTLPSTPPAAGGSGDFEVNSALLSILDAMAEQDADIAEELDKLEDERLFFELIINRFPWNIGAQVARLVSGHESMKALGVTRLEQITSVYIAAAQWMYFVALSQLWREKSDKKIGHIAPGALSLFRINAGNFILFNYLKEFRLVVAELGKAGIPLFAPELGNLALELEKSGSVRDACLYLESLHQLLVEKQIQDMSDAEVAGRCRHAESALATLLCSLSFLVKYQMLTVRDILIDNPRHHAVRYFHKLGKLNGYAEDRLFIFREPKEYREFLQNNSIILIKDMNKEKDLEYLSLSPFFMDKNAFWEKESKESDLYTFAYTGSEANGTREYYYLKSSRNIFNVLQKEFDRLDTGIEIESNLEKKGIYSRSTRIRRLRGDHPLKPFISLKEQFDALSDQLNASL